MGDTDYQTKILDDLQGFMLELFEQNNRVSPFIEIMFPDPTPPIIILNPEMGNPDGSGRRAARAIAEGAASEGATAIALGMEAWAAITDGPNKVTAPGNRLENLPPDDRFESVVIVAAAPGRAVIGRVWIIDRTKGDPVLVPRESATWSHFPVLKDLPWSIR